MVDAVSSPRDFTYSAQEARQAHALLKISIALACARKLRDEGRRLVLDSRGGLMVDPPLDSDQHRRYAGSGTVLEKLLSPQLKNWSEYIDGASVLLERLAAAGARPRESDGHLIADLPHGATELRVMVAFYSAAAAKLLRAQAIVEAEEERVSPWWRRAFAWR